MATMLSNKNQLKKGIMKTTKFIISAILAMASAAANAEAIEGMIVGVSDGDTVTLLTAQRQQVKIRVQGIDAPEKSQAFGTVSRQSMAKMVFQKNVQAQCSSTDRYGRKICVIYLNGVDAGLQLVSQGLAWHYKQYAKEQSPRDRATYAYAEENARAQRAGLWTEQNPISPWDFRKNKSN